MRGSYTVIYYKQEPGRETAPAYLKDYGSDVLFKTNFASHPALLVAWITERSLMPEN